MTSTIQTELNAEGLAWDDDDVFIAKDESEEVKENAMVGDVINSVLEAVVTTSEEPVQVDAISRKKNCPAIGPYLSSSKDEEWLDAMLMAIEELELEYTPHPLPYRGDDGFLHSADVHPPHVDFSALGFNSRRLPTPELHPVYGDPIDCLPMNCLLVGNPEEGNLWYINQQDCLP